MKELLAAVVEFVKAAEAAYPQGAKGADKMQAVSDAVLAYAPVVGLTVDFATQMMPMITAFASLVVKTFNTLGLFRKAA